MTDAEIVARAQLRLAERVAVIEVNHHRYGRFGELAVSFSDLCRMMSEEILQVLKEEQA